MCDCPLSQATAILGSSAVLACKGTIPAGLVDCLQPLMEGVGRLLGSLEPSLSLPVARNAALIVYGSREGIEALGPALKTREVGSIFEAVRKP